MNKVKEIMTMYSDNENELQAPSGRKAPASAKMSLNAVKALYSLTPKQGDAIQLEFKDGDIIQILHKAPPHNGWQYGLNRRTNRSTFLGILTF